MCGSSVSDFDLNLDFRCGDAEVAASLLPSRSNASDASDFDVLWWSPSGLMVSPRLGVTSEDPLVASALTCRRLGLKVGCGMPLEERFAAADWGRDGGGCAESEVQFLGGADDGRAGAVLLELLQAPADRSNANGNVPLGRRLLRSRTPAAPAATKASM